MAALGDDCYFFCTSTCVKGAACPFRHVESAKTCRIICQHWQMGGCLRPMCRFRHSDFVFKLDTAEVLCYWESLPTGCVKINCPYKHLTPRPHDDVVPTAAGSMPVDTSTVDTAPSRTDVNTSQTFVQPVVTPVIIQNLAESEESNSSPMKRPPEVTQESQIQTVSKKQEIELETTENSKVNEAKLSAKTNDQTVKKKTKKATSGVKKVKKNIPVQKVQKKFVEKITEKIKAKSKKNNDRPRKSVKERLGKAPSPEPVIQSSSESSDSESGSDSDDSIENIKVMSMEEIFRQKALESMMKKRVTERKSSTDKKFLSAAGKKTSPAQHKFSPAVKKFEKLAPTVKRVKYDPAPVESSSSSSEEESSDEQDTPEEPSDKSSTGSSGTSSTNSSSDSEDDTAEDSEDLDVRRVVVDLESEKIARKKAKASFLKKQKMHAAIAEGSKKKGQVNRTPARKVNQMPLSTLNKNSSRGKQQNKRRINVDSDSDGMVSSRVKEPLKLNVRDRLGKSMSLHKANSDSRLLSRNEKFRSAVAVSKPIATKKRDTPLLTTSKKSESSSSEDDSDSLAEVKVKTLEEIRLEKMKKQSAEGNKKELTSQHRETGAHKPLPVKQRLGKIPAENQNMDVDITKGRQQRLGKIPAENQNIDVDNTKGRQQRLDKIPAENQNMDVDNMKGRQVVIVNDTGSKSDDASHLKTLDEQKRAKKRPWRSQKRNMDPSSTEVIAGDNERTAVIASLPAEDDYTTELNSYKEEQDVEESPFERLRRKAYMKKLQSRMLKQPASVDGGNSVEAGSETLTKVDVSAEDDDAKTHKHKHNNKHHRRVKIERQIYMPPAMKNTATVPESSTAPEPASPKRELVKGPTASVSPQKRGPHPIAAAWAAGLTMSSKGVGARRPEPTLTPAVSSGIMGRFQTGDRLGARETTATNPKEVIRQATTTKRKETIREAITTKAVRETTTATTKPKVISSIDPSQSSVESSGVTIKSFSEIMAEKRKRRMEMLAQKSGTTDNSGSASISSGQLLSSTTVPPTPNESNSASSKQVDVRPRVPILPIVFAPDKSLGSTVKVTTQADTSTSSSWRVTAQPTVATTVPNFSSPSAMSPIPHNTSVDKVKLKSIKNSKNNVDKKKKVKKLFTKKNSKEQIDLNCSVASEDSSNNISSSSLHPYPVTSIVSETVTPQETSYHYQSNKISNDASSSYKTLSDSKVSSSQNAAGTGSLDVPAKPSVPKFSTKTDTLAVKTSPASSRKHSITSSIVDPESSKKKTRLSIMDEFNFFEDEDLDVGDGIIPEDIEPIDDLLQDIDDLLS